MSTFFVGEIGLEPTHLSISVPKSSFLKKTLVNYTFQICYRRQSDKIVDDVVDTFTTFLVNTLAYEARRFTKNFVMLNSSKI